MLTTVYSIYTYGIICTRGLTRPIIRIASHPQPLEKHIAIDYRNPQWQWLSIASMEITVCPCYLQRLAVGTHETRDTCLQNILATYYGCTIAIGMECLWLRKWVYIQTTMVGHKFTRHTATARRCCSRCAGAHATRAPTPPLEFRRPTTLKTCGNMEHGE